MWQFITAAMGSSDRNQEAGRKAKGWNRQANRVDIDQEGVGQAVTWVGKS